MLRWLGAFTEFVVRRLAPETDFAAGQNPIYLLEKLKDQILAAIDASSHLDDATRSMWRGDAKEMYYNVVLVDQFLSSGLDEDFARSRLHVASSRYQQVRSELKTLGKIGQRLEQDLIPVFSACHKQLAASLPKTIPVGPSEKVIKVSAQKYMLPCSVCGKQAVGVHPAGSEEKILEGIICAGITRAVGLNPRDQEKIFSWLEKADLAALHRYMETDSDIEGGLDAYCPTCGQIYCRAHYNVTEEWDEGFYDCARGTCPHGHSRKIDD